MQEAILLRQLSAASVVEGVAALQYLMIWYMNAVC